MDFLDTLFIAKKECHKTDNIRNIHVHLNFRIAGYWRYVPCIL